MGKAGTTKRRRGRPATGRAPLVALRLPAGWLKQIDRTARATKATRSATVRALIGTALAQGIRGKTNGHGRRTEPAEAETVELDRDSARAFIEFHHYSGTVPTGRSIYFGWFIAGELYAVAAYGDGVNMAHEKYLARVTGKPVRRKNLVELTRLCRTEPARDDYPLSKFIAECHRHLKRERGIRFVVSFSDPMHNRFKRCRNGVPYESGGIYKASNFIYLGKTDAEWHVRDEDGKKMHRRVAYRFKERANAAKYGPNKKRWPRGAMTMEQAREKLGLVRAKTYGKDRWFIDIGK